MRRPLVAWLRCLGVWLAAAALTALPHAPALAAPDNDDALSALRRSYEARLEALAAKCDALGLAEAARRTRAWSPPRSPRQQTVFFPGRKDQGRPPAAAAPSEHFWWERFVQERQRYAAELFQQARACCASRPRLAYALLWEVLREDPEHEPALRILGVTEPWSEPPRVRRLTGPTPPGVAGSGRKMLRLESPHFIVFAAARAPGVQLTDLLERLYVSWRQVYFEYWASPDWLSARWDAQEPAADSDPSKVKHQVVLFPNRQEYLERLAPLEARIQATAGIYLEQPRTAYFYLRDEDATATWLHEVAHQLFAEVHRADASPVATRRNIWAVEGAALYMESLQLDDDRGSIGGPLADRLQFARHRALTEGFFTPFEELSRRGRGDWQAADVDQMRRYYTQSCGLVSWIMDGGDDARRRAFMSLLQRVYAGDEDQVQFTELSGISADELDTSYRRYLTQVDDQDLAFYRNQSNLCLTRTAVSDDGLKHLQRGRYLKWLDLSYTRVTSQGLTLVDQAAALEHLNLDRSQVKADALSVIQRFHKLEHLDLSYCGVDDADLTRLAGLSGLRVLWLTGCPITDEGLRCLRPLRALETLHVEDTSVTQRALRKLAEALPHLKLEENQ